MKVRCFTPPLLMRRWQNHVMGQCWAMIDKLSTVLNRAVSVQLPQKDGEGAGRFVLTEGGPSGY